MNEKVNGKDLTKEAPRSPKTRLGDYVILGRTLDKCRALIGGDIGEYHFDCPLDNMLFGWKNIKGDDFKAAVEKGASDDEMVKWVTEHGDKKTSDETKAWADEMMKTNPYDNPEKREWFVEQVTPYNLDPKTTTLFDWLDVDDRESYKKAA
jgi:hypothetical protein